jgi:hypothetical protein
VDERAQRRPTVGEGHGSGDRLVVAHVTRRE